MLRDAGLEIDCIPADLDENIIKAEGLCVDETALKLSKAKSQFIAAQYPQALVIGADQMMDCKGQRFDKPVSLSQAKDQLSILRGKTHHLISAVSIYKGDSCLWSHIQKAELEMRNFSDEFIDDYLEKIGEDVLTTVGGYRLESLGVQLFNRIEGDYFTILGLPLLSVLKFLRSQGVVSE